MGTHTLSHWARRLLGRWVSAQLTKQDGCQLITHTQTHTLHLSALKHILMNSLLFFFVCFRKCSKPRSSARWSSEEERRACRFWPRQAAASHSFKASHCCLHTCTRMYYNTVTCYFSVCVRSLSAMSSLHRWRGRGYRRNSKRRKRWLLCIRCVMKYSYEVLFWDVEYIMG